MKTGYGFIEFENINEFKTWLAKQKVIRTVNKLQVHHMWMPDYSCWKTDNALRRQYNTKTYHMNHNGWGDIAQHFSIFPNGHIVTGRSLNKTPIGIKGWNTGAICCEIYGNFDKGHDIMNAKQKKAVIAFYGELCKKFKLTPSSSTIRPHCWFTAGGTYLGDYMPSRAAKTCPGTNFMGIGNTKKAFTGKFYPMIKNYMSGNKTSPKPTTKKFQIQILDKLNVRKVADWNAKPVTTVKKGQFLDVVDTVDAKNGSTPMYRLESGLYITASTKYVKKV